MKGLKIPFWCFFRGIVQIESNAPLEDRTTPLRAKSTYMRGVCLHVLISCPDALQKRSLPGLCCQMVSPCSTVYATHCRVTLVSSPLAWKTVYWNKPFPPPEIRRPPSGRRPTAHAQRGDRPVCGVSHRARRGLPRASLTHQPPVPHDSVRKRMGAAVYGRRCWGSRRGCGRSGFRYS